MVPSLSVAAGLAVGEPPWRADRQMQGACVVGASSTAAGEVQPQSRPRPQGPQERVDQH